MNHELICTWLELSAAHWPPDHYHLLGLEQGEADTGRIEAQVHQRLERVRRYQLTHPDLVTEAMNRLAQAFVCLTDAEAKKAYDAVLFGRSSEPPTAIAVEERPGAPAWLHAASEELVPIEPETNGTERKPLDWRTVAELDQPAARTSYSPVPLLPAEAVEAPVAAPPSALEPLPLGQPPALPSPESDQGANPPSSPQSGAAAPPEIVIPDGLPPAAPAPQAEKVDSIVAQASAADARRGLGTKRGLYARIARTRKLLWSWEQAGKYLAEPQRRVTRPAEATDLIRQLARIQALMRGFPPLLGEAGQPGYLVVALARQQTPVPTFQTLLPSQRETLAQHWHAGHKLLTAHRQFLRQEARSLRHRNGLVIAARAVRAFFREYPEYVLFALAVLALTIALARL
jgi:hypothetical protein